jgi:hypothetical protein
MAGKRTGLSQATADRCAQAGPILHPTTPRRRPFNNLFSLLGILAVVLLAVALSWAAADAVRP